MKAESEIQQLIQLQGPLEQCILLRNNSGALKDSEGRVVRFGLGNVSQRHSETIKSSDLIGITTIVVTPEMVGKTLGVFTAIEVKTEKWDESKKLDKHELAQWHFIEWVRLHGGIGGFANSVEAFKTLIDAAKKKLAE